MCAYLAFPLYDNVSTIQPRPQEDISNRKMVSAVFQAGKPPAPSRKPGSQISSLLPLLSCLFHTFETAALGKASRAMCHGAANCPRCKFESLEHSKPQTCACSTAESSNHAPLLQVSLLRLNRNWAILTLANKMLLFTSAIRLEE